MANVPTSSAVLLMHNPSGAVPIASAAGLSGQAAHALSYDSRTGEYEEKGGCEREPTERDRFLAEARTVGEQASRQLDYDSRHGRWAGKGAGSMGDCSFWGQSGPLSREEIERDMLACGGCFLKSVVSVDRRYASELGLDSKQAFQELARGNWQDMMALAGAAERAEDVRWYACYHTDAENSLHVHIATWAPGGLIREGWHPSARATREQKALLYRDAYARVRHERNLERDYYRDLLPKLASAEMGGVRDAVEEERLAAKALRAGIEPVPLGRTCHGSGAEEVDRRAEAVSRRLEEGRGRKSADWRLQSDAGKVVDAIRKASPPFDAALSRYRELTESKADLAGLAVAEARHDPERGRASRAAAERELAAREVTRRERDRFVRREMEDVMRRIRNQVIRSADPSGRERALAREELDRMRHGLVTESLRPSRIGLGPADADRLRQIYQDATRAQLQGRAPGEGAVAMDGCTAAEASRIVAGSEAAGRRIGEAARRIEERTRGDVPSARAAEELRRQIAPRLADAIAWRANAGLVDPTRIEHDRLPSRQESALARDMVLRAEATRGLSLGLARSAGDELSSRIGAARASFASGDAAGTRAQARAAASIVVRSPAMQSALDEAVSREAAANPAARRPDRAFVEASAETAVARRIVAHVSGARDPDAQGAAGGGAQAGVAGLAAMVAAAIIRDRSEGDGAAMARSRSARPAAREAMEEQLESRQR